MGKNITVGKYDNSVITKHLKKSLKFVLNCEINEDDSLKTKRIFVDVFVSPSHFCELLDPRVEKKVTQKCSEVIYPMLFTLYGMKDTERVNFRFFPELEESTIFNYIQ